VEEAVAAEGVEAVAVEALRQLLPAQVPAPVQVQAVEAEGQGGAVSREFDL
jgi:hypothetical protein